MLFRQFAATVELQELLDRGSVKDGRIAATSYVMVDLFVPGSPSAIVISPMGIRSFHSQLTGLSAISENSRKLAISVVSAALDNTEFSPDSARIAECVTKFLFSSNSMSRFDVKT